MTMRTVSIRLALAASCVLALASAGNASVFTSIGTVTVGGDPAGPPPFDPSPIQNIRILSGSSGSGGIYTNQTGGVSGVSGSVNTVSAQQIQTATNGGPFVGVVGPSGGTVIAVTALVGSLGPPLTVDFSAGRLLVYELSAVTAFDRRDPSSWGLGTATLLGDYTLFGPTDVLSGAPDGFAIAPQPASIINLSFPTGPGTNDANLLFMETVIGDPFVTLTPTFTGPFITDGVYVQAKQTVDIFASGSTTSVVPLITLDGTDLGVLNGVFGTAGFGAWATALGTAADNNGIPDPTYYINPLGEGDIYANLEANAYLVGAVPEPTSVIAWAVLSLGGAAAVALRKRNS